MYALFDAVLESRVLGVRKPDPRFYEMACSTLGVEPEESVFLDDLGVNLKPARLLGMHTIKVSDPDQALTELDERARALSCQRLSPIAPPGARRSQAEGGAAAALAPAKRPNSVLSPMESPLA